MPKNDPQGMGSAITYARRYSLCAMPGIVTEDDDGEGAKISSKLPPSQKGRVGGSQRQKGPSDDSTIANGNSGASNRAVADLKNLPNLDGVTYRKVQAQDGRPCIIAKGETLIAAHGGWFQVEPSAKDMVEVCGNRMRFLCAG